MRSIAPDVTEGPRADILACVSRTPGAHLRGIERMTGLPLGQVLYHLDRLEKMGLVVSGRDAGFRRYYLKKDVGRGEKKYLAALRHEVPRRLVVLLLETPGLPHKELQAALGVAGSTLSFHLERLVASGALARRKVGAQHRYHVSEPAVARWDLVYYRESFRDEAVDRYVRRTLDALLAGGAEAALPGEEGEAVGGVEAEASFAPAGAEDAPAAAVSS